MAEEQKEEQEEYRTDRAVKVSRKKYKFWFVETSHVLFLTIMFDTCKITKKISYIENASFSLWKHRVFSRCCNVCYSSFALTCQWKVIGCHLWFTFISANTENKLNFYHFLVYFGTDNHAQPIINIISCTRAI
jgi:hypothetical protein